MFPVSDVGSVGSEISAVCVCKFQSGEGLYQQFLCARYRIIHLKFSLNLLTTLLHPHAKHENVETYLGSHLLVATDADSHS
jgi:hypothetical protein